MDNNADSYSIIGQEDELNLRLSQHSTTIVSFCATCWSIWYSYISKTLVQESGRTRATSQSFRGTIIRIGKKVGEVTINPIGAMLYGDQDSRFQRKIIVSVKQGT